MSASQDRPTPAPSAACLTRRRLSAMHKASRATARRAYAASQSRTPPTTPPATPPAAASPGVRKPVPKAESAFVSRHSSRLYSRALEGAVADAERGLRRLRRRRAELGAEAARLRWQIVGAENAALRAELAALTRQLAEQRAAPGDGAAALDAGLLEELHAIFDVGAAPPRADGAALAVQTVVPMF